MNTMHDWRRRVRKRLEACDLPATTRDDIIAELADHLEASYEAALSQGSTENAAVAIALQEVKDWRVLSANIRQARTEEGTVNNRTRTLWLPAMASLLGASLLLMILQRTSYQPRLVWFGHMAMLFYWPWLAALPVFGALGAGLSRRAHGSTRTRIAAGLSPALVLFAMFCVILPLGLAVDGFSLFRFTYFCLAVTNWVVLPACALFTGTLPFLRETDAATQIEA
jgi:hypothetical protein